jgi:GxxExxY protein
LWGRVSRNDRKGLASAARFQIEMTENDIATLVLDICFKIHRQYGPGLFESVYEEIFCHEWAKTGIPFKRQIGVPLIHEDIRMEVGFRAGCDFRR